MLSLFSGPEVETHGRVAAVCGVRPREQAPDRQPDHAMGGEPGAAPLRAVQAQVLHGLTTEWGTAQSKGNYCSILEQGLPCPIGVGTFKYPTGTTLSVCLFVLPLLQLSDSFVS